MAEQCSIRYTVVPVEKPQNGLRGLKHWRYDLPSGIMVAMISLPFSMGIAITSGAPPVCGIMSAIIAGLVLPFLGGSYVTISGPAAGLAPAIFAGIVTLGAVKLGESATTQAKLEAGYPLVLVAICLAGALQYVLAKLKVARLSAIFPTAAIEGMLVSIGLMIIVKQFPHFLGQKFESHEFWEILHETPGRISGMNPQVLGLGLGCLALLFGLAAIPSRLFKIAPPPVWAFFGGTLVAQLILHLDAKYLIHVPESPLKHGIVLPDFASIWQDSHLWLPLSIIVVTLLLIDGTESLATIAAVDKIDPFRRKSDPDRTLLAMGVSNVCSSVAGGLTIIPGIVKSTANIMGGGRTQWANFYNACCLAIMLVFARDLINMVPYCILASILTFVGYKLCRPKVWRHMARLGKDQFVIFAATVFITVTTDLLIGILSGVALNLVLILWNLSTSAALPRKSLLAKFADLFRNPIGRREQVNGRYTLVAERSLVCFNLFHLIRELDKIPADAREVQLQLSEGVILIDHTTDELLQHYLDEFNPENGKPAFEIKKPEQPVELVPELQSEQVCS